MSKKKPTLDDFLKQKQLKNCPVCKLPKAVRKQIVGRNSQVNLASILPWLKELGYAITERQLSGHYRMRHERARWSP